MPNYTQSEKQKEFEKRLERFVIRVVNLIRSLPKTPENRVFSYQIIKSSSSVGANYAEATCATSRNDFINDLNRSRKESKETLYWLMIIEKTNPDFSQRMKEILIEGEEIFKIFNSAVKTAKSKQK